MLTDTAIRVESLGKLYHIGSRRQGYRTFREALSDAVSTPFRKTMSLFRDRGALGMGAKETIWALREVSFQVQRGEVTGIIGHNGAGKSTLLKILSRITEPSVGSAEIRGRVGSLLEVGTGFHPELTGRENVYLNGAILGMSRVEIRAAFDEIIAFAEVEKFIETPVKHYSSGMYLRLAFAVAAHLQPEILLVDEVLAVGDAAFQKKCLGKMGEVARQGRTVLLVSHNMAAIESLCQKVAWIHEGRLREFSDRPAACIEAYLNHNLATTGAARDAFEVTLDEGLVAEIWLTDGEDQPLTLLKTGDAIAIHARLNIVETLANPRLRFLLESATGQKVATFDTTIQMPDPPLSLAPGGYHVRCELPPLPLAPDEYFLTMKVFAFRELLFERKHLLRLEILESNYYQTGKSPTRRMGLLALKAGWRIEQP